MGVFADVIRRAPSITRLPVSGAGRRLGSMMRTSTPEQVAQQAFESFASSGWIFSIVSRIANGAARVDWNEYVAAPTASLKTKRMMQKNNRVNRSAHFSHDRITNLIKIGDLVVADDEGPALALWNNPNPFFSQHELVEVVQQHLELTGEAYIVILRDESGLPAELWPVRPDRMEVVPDNDKFVNLYVYKNGDERIPLAAEDVIFLRMPSPVSMYRGMGPVQAVLFDIDSDRYASQWNRNFFTNGAEPGGIIEAPEGLDPSEWDRLTSQWREEHQGVAQSHRVAVLEKARWVDRKYSHTDMSFIDGRKLNRDLFLGAWGMPGSLVGVSENVNRANAEAGEVVFARWLIVPRLDRIKMALNSRLVSQFPGYEDRVLDYVNPAPEDLAMHLAIGIGAYKAGLSTKDEGRAEIGLPPAEDGSGADFFTQPPSTPEANVSDGTLQLSKAAPESWPSPLRKAEREMAEAWEKRLSDQADIAVETLRERWVDDTPSSARLVEAMLAGLASL